MKKITAQNVAIGKQIEPLKRVYEFSPEDYEIFISEWLELKVDTYFNIEHFGGAGDMGRDVVAYYENPQSKPDDYKWDCYQCKRYNTPLAPSKAWIELGKIIYYSYIKEYPLPLNYFFVPSKGVGTRLSNYLNNPVKLKEELLKQWDSKCKINITNKNINLDEGLLEYIHNIDFSIFKKIQPTRVIEEHKTHSNCRHPLYF